MDKIKLNGNINYNLSRLFRWSIIAGLAGFLFGFDTVVISGADKTLQSLWSSSDLYHGIIVMSMALWGTVIGAIFGGIPNDKLGRKKTLILIGVLYSISAIGSSLAVSAEIFSLFRFIGGIGIGISTIAVPSYITEISPPENRGTLVSLYQFNVVFGMLFAFLSNYILNDFGISWRVMIGIEIIPAIIYTIFTFSIPNSHRWLIANKRSEEAEIVLNEINSKKITKQLMTEIILDVDAKKLEENIFLKKYRFILYLTFLIAFFNQFSGINAILYYAPRIFEETGLGYNDALLSSVLIGIVMVAFTLIGVFLIDRIGRKNLMYFGSIGYIISLSLISFGLAAEWGGVSVPILIFIFIASHGIGQGTVIWVFISEIFPNHLRSSGQSFGSSVHWILAAIIPSMIPYLFSTIGSEIVFSFFTLMMIFQLLFVKYLMPETKGVSIEELFKKLIS